jgi:hypothetical protein
MATDDEFWRDDAAAIAKRQSGNVLRMPAASTVVPSELVGSYARPSADYRAEGFRQYSTTATLVCMALIVAAFGGILYWLRPDNVTLAEFERLQIGMTPDECRAIIGEPGTITADARLSGFRMPDGQALFQDQLCIEWKNNSKSSCAADFAGGYMNMKAQEGLR